MTGSRPVRSSGPSGSSRRRDPVSRRASHPDVQTRELCLWREGAVRRAAVFHGRGTSVWERCRTSTQEQVSCSSTCGPRHLRTGCPRVHFRTAHAPHRGAPPGATPCRPHEPGARTDRRRVCGWIRGDRVPGRGSGGPRRGDLVRWVQLVPARTHRPLQPLTRRSACTTTGHWPSTANCHMLPRGARRSHPGRCRARAAHEHRGTCGRPRPASAGDDAVIIGAGGIGASLAYAAARATERVVVADPRYDRLRTASELGATEVSSVADDGDLTSVIASWRVEPTRTPWDDVPPVALALKDLGDPWAAESRPSRMVAAR